jgi:hypothetical protein
LRFRFEIHLKKNSKKNVRLPAPLAMLIAKREKCALNSGPELEFSDEILTNRWHRDGEFPGA